MPYLQLDLDAKKRVPHVARALGVPEHQAGWGLINLWEWCWTEKRDRAQPAHLAGFFGAPGADVASTLEAFGFLEAAPDGYRVRGAERYLRLAAAWSAGGKKAAGNLKRGRSPARAGGQPETGPEDSRDTGRESAPALTPSTEHRAPVTSPSETCADAPRSPPRARKAPEKPTDPRHAPLVQALVAACPGYAFTARDAKAVTSLLALGEPDEVTRRWRLALATDGFPRVRTLSELSTHWNHFAGAGPPGRAARGRASEADKDWSNYTPNAAAF